MIRIFLTLTLLGSTCSLSQAQDLERIQMAKLMSLTAEEGRVDAFADVDSIFPVITIEKASEPFHFKKSLRQLDDITYSWQGDTHSAKAFLEETTTTSFIVVKDDALVFEEYFHGYTSISRPTSMSVAKSFISALVGIAVEEGHIKNIDDPIDQYVPELSESGYKGVSIRHILQMTSGIDFTEVYDDASSDLMVMMMRLAGGHSIIDYTAALPSAEPSGQRFNYASIDTAVLGFLIERATQKNPAEYLEEKIWKRIGMESNATWATDNHGNVLAFAWLNATPLDFARFGRLYLNKGRWDGTQIIPADWVQESVIPSEDHLQGPAMYGPEWDIGYQYQWWVPEGNEGEFTAIGIWGQYIYINPERNIIIVKTSVDPLFDSHDIETIAMFRGIGAAITKAK